MINAHLGGPTLWRFWKEMRDGDLVIVSDGKRRRLVMRVEGDYQWNAGKGYRHWRPASVVEDQDANWLWKRCGGLAQGENVRWTLALRKNGQVAIFAERFFRRILSIAA
jgi:hypothetical protein